MAIKTDTNDIEAVNTELFIRMYEATPRDKRRSLNPAQIAGRMAWAQDVSSMLVGS
jgi:hypothetical protein